MKSVVKQIRNSIPNTKIVISGVIGRRDKKDLEEQVSDLIKTRSRTGLNSHLSNRRRMATVVIHYKFS